MGEWVLADVDVVLAFDAMDCPDPVPPGYAVAMPYIGGSSAAHAWTAAELARVEHMHRIPYWVPTPGVDDPRRAAGDCLARLRELGVPSFHDTGVHVVVAWDLETGREPDRAWLDVARGRMHQAGYYTAPYLTRSVLAAPATYHPCAGYIVAAPTGQLHMHEAPNVIGTQFAWNVRTPGGRVNQTALLAGMLANAWQPVPKVATGETVAAGLQSLGVIP